MRRQSVSLILRRLLREAEFGPRTPTRSSSRVFTAQANRAQLILVGDSAQAIYGWRGARDIMTGFAGTQLRLSHSFRFSPRPGQRRPGSQRTLFHDPLMAGSVLTLAAPLGELGGSQGLRASRPWPWAASGRLAAGHPCHE